MSVLLRGLGLAAAIFAQPLASEDEAPLSVRNEIEHALERAPTNSAAPAAAVAAAFALAVTNGVGAKTAAIRLVSAQRSDGGWLFGTNDVTITAKEILEDL